MSTAGRTVRLAGFRAIVLALLLILGGAPALAATDQEPALPQDAKALLQYHAGLSGLAPVVRASEVHTLERAYVYLLAGAEGELRTEIQNLTEDHPDALRFAMQADCWNPNTFADGKRRAETWLAAYAERSAAEVGAVTAVRDWLEEAEMRRATLQEDRARSRWYPLAAGLAVVLGLGLLVRKFP